MEPGFPASGVFASLLGQPPSYSAQGSLRLNFSSLMMHVSPPCALTEQTKAGNSGKTGKGTCCLLTCAAPGGERALSHTGGSAVSHQKRKSILSALPPSSRDPILLVKTRLLFPGCLLLSPAPCCGWGRCLPSLQSQHKALQGFQPAKRWGGESCRCHGNNACTELRCPSGAGELETLNAHFIARPHCGDLHFQDFSLKLLCIA